MVGGKGWMRAAVAGAAMLVTVGAAPAVAKRSDGRLTTHSEVERFAGSLAAGETAEFPIAVQLPVTTWKHDGGVQFAVHWDYPRTPPGEDDPTAVEPTRVNL